MNIYPNNIRIISTLENAYKLNIKLLSIFFQSKPDDEELDPTDTPTPSEKKQKKFDDNDTNAPCCKLVYPLD